MTQPVEKSPISFEVSVVRLPKSGMPVVIEATERQRAALAEIHGLAAVKALRAELMVKAWRRNGVRVEGRVVADIVQNCVVTLDPIDAHVDEKLEATFLPEESKLGRQGFGEGGEILIDVDGPDSPDTFSGDRIDVGAVAEEHFGLALDPYPRKAGAAIASTVVEEPAEAGKLQQKLRSLFPKS